MCTSNFLAQTQHALIKTKWRLSASTFKLTNFFQFPISPTEIGFISVKKIEVENLTLGHLSGSAPPPTTASDESDLIFERLGDAGGDDQLVAAVRDAGHEGGQGRGGRLAPLTLRLQGPVQL